MLGPNRTKTFFLQMLPTKLKGWTPPSKGIHKLHPLSVNKNDFSVKATVCQTSVLHYIVGCREYWWYIVGEPRYCGELGGLMDSSGILLMSMIDIIVFVHSIIVLCLNIVVH
ncbi:hypothetical protein CDAR_186631 [Caerostris darwini]|uniref:Uncharacterized protein n=1 Tax=Caerostris darwini TaxID=1538125 RepID=A0AAV4VUQ1_9ARAC|nr:hypothetical protein CDAR_186631 [Caerostris darwini]